MKRFLFFLLLVAIGIAALRFAIDDDVIASSGATTPSNGEPPPPPPRTGGGVPMRQEGNRIGGSVSQTGRLEFPQYRSIDLGDGTTRNEPLFRLKAKDSKPLNESVQQLDGVEVLLYDDGQPAAQLDARQAFVELARDASGNVSLRQHKDIDLRDAVFTTLPGTKLAGMRLELGNAKVRIGEDEVQLDSANDTDPVLLVVDGQRTGTLRGKGLQARFPRGRSSPMQRADLEILHEPVLETSGITVNAKGRMHYVEDIAAGTAQVTLDDDVRVDLTQGRFRLPGALGSAKVGENTTSEIRGDQFTGWLMRDQRRGKATSAADRERDRDRDGLVWRQLLLTGAPATVAIGANTLRTPRILVLPGPFGDPGQVTAFGGESSLDIHDPDNPVRGTAPRRIHLSSPGNSIGAMHRQLGFPQWALRPLNELQIVAFDGNSRLESGSRTVTAKQGMQIVSRGDAKYGRARGLGDVVITQVAKKAGEQDLVVVGNDGFERTFANDVDTWWLGPRTPDVTRLDEARWKAHRYEIRHGEAIARGTGSCRIDRAGERTTLFLRAPGPTISGRLPTQGVDLDGLDFLTATLERDDVLALDAAGLPARATRSIKGDVVTATAPRLVQIGPRSLRLLSAPGHDPDRLWADLAPEHARPVLSRSIAALRNQPAMNVTVEGPQIDAHHLGGEDVWVEAIEVDDWLPVVDATWSEAGAAPAKTTFEARRLRALPFATTHEARLLHAGGASGPVAELAFQSFGKAWLIADDVRRFRLDDPRYGTVEGTGKRLVLAQGAEAAMFLGDPDTLEPATVSRSHHGQTAIARGARVRVFRDDSIRLQALRTFTDRPTFVLPSVTLHDTNSTGLLSHMTASCQGNIDVLPESVEFHGPVVARGVHPDGTDDPNGMNITAKGLRMIRSGDQVTRVIGSDVVLDWSEVTARSAEVELDLRWNTLVARDPDRARVTLADGRYIEARHVKVNYQTMALSSSNGKLVQGGDVQR